MGVKNVLFPLTLAVISSLQQCCRYRTACEVYVGELQTNFQSSNRFQDHRETCADSPATICPRFHQLQRVPVCLSEGHSTESALLEILDGVYTAADNKEVTVLIGLDLSAAFDTVDHEILLERLQTEFGVEVLRPAGNWTSMC